MHVLVTDWNTIGVDKFIKQNKEVHSNEYRQVPDIDSYKYPRMPECKPFSQLNSKSIQYDSFIATKIHEHKFL